ncbi:FadR/GntR family transcriptional regulator [Telmatospirillum sp.]|uniref:FadR/GntR family transcriptional regulator n=1 Tax=Telmatospirillum sp. TaxID=2079197 RepID=UPI0028421E1A|nr:FadR/GntR family transcriptional regulator [Telmatospirillum sp.]MDR3437388.1 FadR/GntR family transcriptional regulator [Telmatospirillum sp.]
MDKDSLGPRRTFHEEILNQLGQDICSGRYNPGDVVPSEPVLCDQYRVSRIVVREVIKSLAAKGLLEVRRKTGTVVLPRDHWQLFDPDVVGWHASSATIDKHFVADLMELRRVIEPAAARLAAQKASDEDRQTIRTAFSRMVDSAGVNERYVPADLAFHNAILTACHNQFLWQMHSALSVILRTSFVISSRVPQGPRKSLSLHEDLCAGIENGNADAAEQAVLKLIARAESDLANAVAALPDTGGTTVQQ